MEIMYYIALIAIVIIAFFVPPKIVRSKIVAFMIPLAPAIIVIFLFSNANTLIVAIPTTIASVTLLMKNRVYNSAVKIMQDVCASAWKDIQRHISRYDLSKEVSYVLESFISPHSKQMKKYIGRHYPYIPIDPDEYIQYDIEYLAIIQVFHNANEAFSATFSGAGLRKIIFSDEPNMPLITTVTRQDLYNWCVFICDEMDEYDVARFNYFGYVNYAKEVASFNKLFDIY